MHMHLSRLLLSVHCFQFKRESYDEKLVTAVAQCAFIDYGAILNKLYYILPKQKESYNNFLTP